MEDAARVRHALAEFREVSSILTVVCGASYHMKDFGMENHRGWSLCIEKRINYPIAPSGSASEVCAVTAILNVSKVA